MSRRTFGVSVTLVAFLTACGASGGDRATASGGAGGNAAGGAAGGASLAGNAGDGAAGRGAGGTGATGGAGGAEGGAGEGGGPAGSAAGADGGGGMATGGGGSAAAGTAGRDGAASDAASVDAGDCVPCMAHIGVLHDLDACVQVKDPAPGAIQGANVDLQVTALPNGTCMLDNVTLLCGGTGTFADGTTLTWTLANGVVTFQDSTRIFTCIVQ